MQANRPVFYPNDNEKTKIPSVLGYPKNPGEKIKSVWESANRVGAIFMMTIKSSLSASLQFTKLSENNIGQLYNNSSEIKN